MTAPRHIFETYIRATPEVIWRAITDPDFTRRYFHRTAIDSSFAAGAAVRYVLPDGEDAVVGVIEEVDPPHRLVMTWRVLYDAVVSQEPPSRVEWILTAGRRRRHAVTTIHRDLGLSPRTSASVGDGWPWILDSLKSLARDGCTARRRAARLAGGRSRRDDARKVRCTGAWRSTPTAPRGSSSSAGRR